MTEKTTFWISKHALSSGIVHTEAEMWEHDPTGNTISGETCLYHKWEWHRSAEDAQKRAKAMREKKIKSLRKQIARLEALDFTVEGEQK